MSKSLTFAIVQVNWLRREMRPLQ